MLQPFCIIQAIAGSHKHNEANLMRNSTHDTNPKHSYNVAPVFFAHRRVAFRSA
jgi:hypothetical protein